MTERIVPQGLPEIPANEDSWSRRESNPRKMPANRRRAANCSTDRSARRRSGCPNSVKRLRRVSAPIRCAPAGHRRGLARLLRVQADTA
jgi:hypothetical protein